MAKCWCSICIFLSKNTRVFLIMAPTRRSFTAEFKLKVVDYALQHGNRNAGRTFHVDERCVRDWRKNSEELKNLPPKKRACRRGKIQWPQLETNLKTWIIAEREANRPVSTSTIQMKAQEMAKQMHLINFKGGSGWCHKFMKQNSLSVWTPPILGQKIPLNWRDKVDNFRSFVSNTLKKMNLEDNDFYNMDEIPLYFDAPITRTVDATNSITISTTEIEKTHFTVVLCCSANGDKVKPLVIFKEKNFNETFFNEISSNIDVCVVGNEKGWIDDDIMSIWIEKCWQTRSNTFLNQHSFLIMDSMRLHTSDETKEKFEKIKAHFAIVPQGFNKLLQPLDLGINRSVKSMIRAQWEEWMKNGLNVGKMSRVSSATVCEWVDKAWKTVPTKCIQKCFFKAIRSNINCETEGYSNSESNSDVESICSESSFEEVYQPLLDQEMIQMFCSDSEGSDFDGF